MPGARRLPVVCRLRPLLVLGALLAAATTHAGRDPHGRDTPRGTLRGFLAAAGDGRWGEAAAHLDLSHLPAAQREREGARLARQLKRLLDRKLWIDLDQVSDEVEGDPDDALAPGVDRLGSIESKHGPVAILVERTAAPGEAPAWRLSSRTVERIRPLHDELGYGPLGELLPPAFFEIHFLHLALWQWLGAGVLLLLAWVAASVVVRLLGRAALGVALRTPTPLDDALVERSAAPVRLVLIVLLVRLAAPLLELPAPAAALLGDLTRSLAVVAACWLLVRLLGLFAHRTEERLISQGQVYATSAVRLATRTLQVFVAVLGLVVLLQNLGFDVTGVVAGLGIGGLALALAAQKTVENLIAGATLVLDRPLRVGDVCRVGDRIGTIEEIGIRSTRMRLLDRQIVTLPNSDLANVAIENYATRDRCRYAPRIGLRCETTPDQLRHVLVELKRLLLAHPMIDPDPARVRFVGFGAASLDIEILAFVRTADWNEYLAVAEDLNLRILELVRDAGTGLAFPSQTLYLGRDVAGDPERRARAEEAVRQARLDGRLALPDPAPGEAERLRGTLDWPPRGCARAGEGGPAPAPAGREAPPGSPP